MAGKSARTSNALSSQEVYPRPRGRLCEYCGRKFKTRHSNARCCCVAHYNALYYKEHHNDTTISGYTKTKVCPICGTVFTTTRDKRRYCYNKACVRQAKAEKDKERRK